jgi:hypothetical protein
VLAHHAGQGGPVLDSAILPAGVSCTAAAAVHVQVGPVHDSAVQDESVMQLQLCYSVGEEHHVCGCKIQPKRLCATLGSEQRALHSVCHCCCAAGPVAQGIEQSNLLQQLGPARLFNPAHASCHWVLDLSHPAHEDVARKLVRMLLRVFYVPQELSVCGL